MKLTFKEIDCDLTVCKVPDLMQVDIDDEFLFIGKTDEEISVVCRSENTPSNAFIRDDGWKAFRVEGVLDFSLVGILSEISGILAHEGIGIFAVSTYNTDYILVKRENFDRALEVLRRD